MAGDEKHTAADLTQYVSPIHDLDAHQPNFNPIHAYNKSHDYIKETLEQHGFQSSQFNVNMEQWGGSLQQIAHPKGHFQYLTAGGQQDISTHLTATQQARVKACLEALRAAREVLLPAEGEHCLFFGMASESDYEVVPIILEVPEVEGGGLRAEAVAAALGVDPQLLSKFPEATVFDSSEAFLQWFEKQNLKLQEYDPSDPCYSDMERLVEAARKLFGGAATSAPYMHMILGNEEMFNPIPVMWLAAGPSPGIVLGLMSLVVWT